MPDTEQADAPLSQVAFEHIREAIHTCRFAAGERLRERDLAAALGTSRVPIREAFPRLVNEGLIRIDPRRGAIVAPITAKDVDDLYNLRAVLEPFAAAMAAQQIQDEQVEAFHAALAAALAAIGRGDIPALDAANKRIHHLIVQTAGSDLLAFTFAPLDSRTGRLSRVTEEADPLARHREHETIVHAIVTRNAPLAASSSFTHVELGRERTRAALETHPHFVEAKPARRRRAPGPA